MLRVEAPNPVNPRVTPVTAPEAVAVVLTA
jgi:hypothetical protein